MVNVTCAVRESKKWWITGMRIIKGCSDLTSDEPLRKWRVSPKNLGTSYEVLAERSTFRLQR